MDRAVPSCALQTVAAIAVAAFAVICACNRPKVTTPCSEAGRIRTLCGFCNPEDLEHLGQADLVLVTNMRTAGGSGGGSRERGDQGGYISAFIPGAPTVRRLWPDGSSAIAEPRPQLGDPSCLSPPRLASFDPHGLTSRVSPGSDPLVYVVGHGLERDGGREAIEIFSLRGKGADARLVWNACIPTPDRVQANDVAVTHDGTVVASNYRPDGSLMHMVKASLFGSYTGDLIIWTAAEGWRHVRGTEASLANGVAATKDGSMLFYAESATGRVHRLPRNGGGGAISVRVDGNPDNLSWTANGKLLVASHTAGRTFGLCLLGRRPCKTAWAVFEVDPVTLAVDKVLEHDGSVIGAVSTALRVDEELLLGSVFGDRIGLVGLR